MADGGKFAKSAKSGGVELLAELVDAPVVQALGATQESPPTSAALRALLQASIDTRHPL
jgi:hypothetical protein